MHPAIALLEFESVAIGIAAGDAMVKRSPVSELLAGTVHPGRYLVLVAGDVASVEESVAAGRELGGPDLRDLVFLPDVHSSVVSAIRGGRRPPAGESLGIVETASVPAAIQAADAGVKGAAVDLLEIHLADGLGGKGYVLLSGSVSDVEAAADIARSLVAPEALVGSAVIAQLHAEMADNLFAAHRFGSRVGWDGGHDAAG